MKILGLGIIAFLLFLLQVKIYRTFWDKHLFVSLDFSKTFLTEGEKGQILEVIENKKRLPLPMLKMQFQTSRNLQFENTKVTKNSDQYYRSDVFQIGGGERITRSLPFIAGKRGYYQIKVMNLVASDLFFTKEFFKTLDTDKLLYVYPKCYDSEQFSNTLQKLNGDVVVKRHLLEDPFTYRGIREYQPSDEPRSINWKASAKCGGLMVNQRSYTSSPKMHIFVNATDNGVLKKDLEIEASIQMLMGIATTFLNQGIQVACYSNGKDILTDETTKVLAGAGIRQLDTIGRAFARLDTSKNPQSFIDFWNEVYTKENEEQLHIFLSIHPYPDFLETLDVCKEKNIPYLWIYPYAEKEPPEVPDGYTNNLQFIKIDKTKL